MIAERLKYFATAVFVSTGLLFAFSTIPALASCDAPVDNQEAIQCGTCNANGSTGNTCDSAKATTEATTSINKTITTFINIITAIVGVISVVMIVVAGFRYTTSGGQADKIAGAKNALIYAIIGITIAVLAQIIAKFVLTEATK